MKKLSYRKYWFPALQLVFWLLSVNFWCLVFNPGVESSGIINGLNEYWPLLLLVNTAFLLYLLLPFVWLLKNAGKWLKISATSLFLLPLLWLLLRRILPVQENEDIALFKDLFTFNFLYVIIFHLTLFTSVTVNLKLLIPRFLAGSRFGLFLVWLVVLTGVTGILNVVLFDYLIDKLFPSLYFISYFNIPEVIFIAAVYLIFTTLAYLVWQYAILLISNREKIQNELSALKAQVNPHFLFNNLNTIYSLTATEPERSKSVILKLSDFLRYVLYDTSADSIPLEKEAEIIKTYVELQKERIDPTLTEVSFSAEGDFGNTMITPLLLLPLTENCFKHGVGIQPGSIRIALQFQDNLLIFKTENPIVSRKEPDQSTGGGIGIKNVQKRLNLLYPNRHSLRFEEKEKVYHMELKVELT